MTDHEANGFVGRGMLLLAGCLLWMGCATELPQPEQVYFKSQEEAGSVQVGVQSVAPFEEYIDSLQPRFVLDEQGAFNAAISQTQMLDIRQLEVLLARLNIALPSSTRAVQEVETRTNDAEESSRTETETLTPPTAPAATAPTTTATLGGVPSAPAGTVGPNIFAQYSAAASLFQYVALLNSYVREAAVSTNTVPYIVRLIVTVLPSARPAPYDAYATVSFFLDTTGEPTPYLADESIPAGWQKSQDFDCNGNELQVIPLFVTDNLESSSTTSAREALRGVDASIGGIVSNIGIGGGVTQSADASVGSRGVELNGVQTIAATSRNTLQLRMSAANFQGSFAAVPRTFNLTALVLVPSKSADSSLSSNLKQLVLACENIRFYAQSQFRSAKTGKPLPSMSSTALSQSLGDVIQQELCPAGATPAREEMVAAAKATSYASFAEKVKSAGCQEANAPALWPRIVNLVNASGHSRGSVPLTKSVFYFFTGSADDPKVPILDDGKSARITLAGGERLDSKGLSAHLAMMHNGKMIRLQSTSATVTPDRRGAAIVFPSVKAFFGDMAPGTPVPSTAKIQIDYSPPFLRWAQNSDVIRRWKQEDCPILVAKEKPKAKSGFDLRATAGFIRVRRDGTGELAIEIKKTDKNPQKVLLQVSGAILGGVTPEIPFLGAYRVADTDRTYVLSLRNLVGGTTVTVRSWRMEGEEEVPAPDVSLFVMPELPSEERGGSRLPTSMLRSP